MIDPTSLKTQGFVVASETERIEAYCGEDNVFSEIRLWQYQNKAWQQATRIRLVKENMSVRRNRNFCFNPQQPQNDPTALLLNAENLDDLFDDHQFPLYLKHPKTNRWHRIGAMNINDDIKKHSNDTISIHHDICSLHINDFENYTSDKPIITLYTSGHTSYAEPYKRVNFCVIEGTMESVRQKMNEFSSQQQAFTFLHQHYQARLSEILTKARKVR